MAIQPLGSGPCKQPCWMAGARSSPCAPSMTWDRWMGCRCTTPPCVMGNMKVQQGGAGPGGALPARDQGTFSGALTFISPSNVFFPSVSFYFQGRHMAVPAEPWHHTLTSLQNPPPTSIAPPGSPQHPIISLNSATCRIAQQNTPTPGLRPGSCSLPVPLPPAPGLLSRLSQTPNAIPPFSHP